MNPSHFECTSGGDGVVLPRDDVSETSRTHDAHSTDNFCNHQYATRTHSSSSSTHDDSSYLPSHYGTWPGSSQYAPNYVQAPYDFAEYPAQVYQPYSQHGEYYSAQASYSEDTYGEYTYGAQHSAVYSFASYPHTERSYSSPEATVSAVDFVASPNPSQISTYSSLSNALDESAMALGISPSSSSVFYHQQVHPPSLVPSESPSRVVVLSIDPESSAEPMTPPSSTPSSLAVQTPTHPMSALAQPRTFELIQDISAFPSSDKPRKRQIASAGLLSNEPTSPFTTEPLTSSGTMASVAPMLAPAPARKPKTSRAAKDKDAPRKKPHLACLFCRERKIACGLPAEDDEETRCNQCVKRSRVCEMPKESRRGHYTRRKADKEKVDSDVITALDGDKPTLLLSAEAK